MPSLDDFKALPICDAPDNTRWVLWHDEAGAVTLDAGATWRKRRVATLSSAKGRPTCEIFAGSRAEFRNGQRRDMRAPLPDDAPEGGPALLEAAIGALKESYEPAPLALREGRTRADLERVLSTAALLASRSRHCYDFCILRCCWDPRQPIAEAGRSAHPARLDLVIVEDIGIWFGAFVPVGEALASDYKMRAHEASGLFRINRPTDNPTAHELLEAAAVIADFYARAAGDLGLTQGEVAARIAVFNNSDAKP